MNDSPVDCQNTSVTEPQREGRAIADGGVGGVLGSGTRKKHINMKQDSDHAASFHQRHPKHILPDSNHATNFEPYGSRRQNFKRNSAPCSSLRSEQDGATPQIQKREAKKQGARFCVPLAFWLPLLDSNQRHPVITNLPLPRQIAENCKSNSPRQFQLRWS